jgi:hypothetical protein
MCEIRHEGHFVLFSSLFQKEKAKPMEGTSFFSYSFQLVIRDDYDLAGE